MARVRLASATGKSHRTEKQRKLCRTMTFLVEVGGGNNGVVIPRDVFQVALEFIMAYPGMRGSMCGLGLQLPG